MLDAKMKTLWGRESLRVGVVGAGSYGTALAQLAAGRGHDVTMWCHRQAHADALAHDRENRRYLPGFPLHDNIDFTHDPAAVADGADILVSVVPSQATRAVVRTVGPHLAPDTVVVCASKGIEEGTHARMDEVLTSILPPTNAERLVALSGPSFARELMEGQPTAVSVASETQLWAEMVQVALHSPVFRSYFTTDVVGVEIGGAVKNIIAIAVGIADGMGLGHNSRAAIITRGLAEITRLGTTLGARPETFMGLAGMGDLVLTCTGGLSRNRSVGLRLGKGETLAEIRAGMDQVAEGVATTRSTWELACERQVSMPIVEQVHAILYEQKPPRAGLADLMSRAPKPEVY